jgi:ribosome-binding ATPase
MAIRIGIVGLPNVGKSTLFNSLTRSRGADAQNYPFCTIEPNVGIVEVPDMRLTKLGEISNSAKVIPTAIEFVDIAGLVKGASEGEGLGNKFLHHIRECDAIGHVVRVFDDPNITHVHGKIDPQMDKEVIEAELLLSDIATVEKRLAKAQSESKAGDKEKIAYANLIERVMSHLDSGKLAVDLEMTEEESQQIHDLHLLTKKPNIYVVNLPEGELAKSNKELYANLLGLEDTSKIVTVCAQLEQELIDLNDQETMEYLETLGVQETGLNNLISAAYKTLGLLTFFTSGETETRAWTVNTGAFAPQAAGKIHTDFEKGFIKAEVVHADDFIEHGGEQKAKESGKLRLEGKDYLVKDGDIMHFKFSS